eukprot:g1831.t1
MSREDIDQMSGFIIDLADAGVKTAGLHKTVQQKSGKRLGVEGKAVVRCIVERHRKDSQEAFNGAQTPHVDPNSTASHSGPNVPSYACTNGVALGKEAAAAAAATATAAWSTSSTSVFLDHDGGNDDFVALVYLLKHEPRFDLLGVSVTAANSWEKAGTRASRKILRMFSEKHVSPAARGPIPVAESTLTGVNAFPDAWRYDACKVNLLPQLNRFETEEQARRLEEGEDDPSNGMSGQMLLAQTLLGSERPVTVIATGPLTNLAWALENYPEVSSKIDKVLIMGGAIDVPGNVFPDDVGGHDGTAEWNIFWDPPAAKRVWDSALELVLTPLDATDEVPITKEMLLRLGRQNHCASSTLVGSIWALAGAHLLETHSRPFFAWDLLTVAQLVHPELFTTSQVECDVVVEGASQGRVVRTGPGAQHPPAGDGGRGGGRSITVTRARAAEEVMDVILHDQCST